MVGPASFTTKDEAGILIEGYDRRPVLQTPWHHPYYRTLMEHAGLDKAMDLYMWDLSIHDREQRMLPVLEELAAKLEPEHGIRIRNMRKRDLEAEIRRFVDVYNDAWSTNWGFVLISEEEFVHAGGSKPLLDEELFVAEKDGEAVAAALTFPDFNEVLAQLDGRLLPLGWLKALWWRRRIDRLRVGFLSVKPEHQHTGVAAGLYLAHFQAAPRKP